MPNLTCSLLTPPWLGFLCFGKGIGSRTSLFASSTRQKISFDAHLLLVNVDLSFKELSKVLSKIILGFAYSTNWNVYGSLKHHLLSMNFDNLFTTLTSTSHVQCTLKTKLHSRIRYLTPTNLIHFWMNYGPLLLTLLYYCHLYHDQFDFMGISFTPWPKLIEFSSSTILTPLGS